MFFQNKYSFAADRNDNDISNDMILDSGSSINLFCNQTWLQDVKHSNKTEHLATNAGDIQVQQQGTLPDYGTVPYHTSAVTNIMSLAQLTDKYRVTFDSDVDNAFLCPYTDQSCSFWPKPGKLIFTYSDEFE